MAREFIVPGQIISGAGALDMAQGALAQFGKKALIVTDKVMIELGNCEKVENVLKKEGIAYSVYSGITGEPTDQMIEAGLLQYKAENCDFLIALGGGSPIDSMKAIASLVADGGSISDYMGKEIKAEMPPIIAIPTTAGTGSEATQFTIITDTKKDIKMLLRGKVLMPDLAVIDPQFTMTAPPEDHGGYRIGRPLPCGGGVYVQKGTGYVRYLCLIGCKADFQISSGSVSRRPE